MSIQGFDFENATDEEIEALGGFSCNAGLDSIPEEDDEAWMFDSA